MTATQSDKSTICQATVVMNSIVERTFLFTDIEGSTRLWEQDPERMSRALAQHDARARAAVEDNDGAVVKMRGDGLHAAFDDPVDGLKATLALQHSLADPDDALCLPLVNLDSERSGCAQSQAGVRKQVPGMPRAAAVTNWELTF